MQQKNNYLYLKKKLYSIQNFRGGSGAGSLSVRTHPAISQNAEKCPKRGMKSSWKIGGVGKEIKLLRTLYTPENYCAPIWTPTLSDSSWADLQAAQNGELRVITGCTKMTDISHLHSKQNLCQLATTPRCCQNNSCLKQPTLTTQTTLTSTPNLRG